MAQKAKIKIKQIGSPIRRDGKQLLNLKSLGLGLGKTNKVVELDNTPAIQGLIKKVSHMVEILENEGERK